MTTQTVTLDLPDRLYQKLKVRAAQTQRSVEAEALDALTTSVTANDELPDDLEESLTSLQFLDDDALWRAARSTILPDASEQLEELHFKRQREGLTDIETQIAANLLHHYERTMLVRTQAAVLLKQRGYDISILLTQP